MDLKNSMMYNKSKDSPGRSTPIVKQTNNVHDLSLQSILNFNIFKKRSSFHDNNLLENLIRATFARPFIPLQVYHRLYDIFKTNNKIFQISTDFYQKWQQIQGLLLFPIEDNITNEWQQENKDKDYPRFPESIQEIMKNMENFKISLFDAAPYLKSELNKLFEDLRLYYSDFMKGLIQAATKGERELTEYLKPKPVFTSNLMHKSEYYTISSHTLNLIINLTNNMGRSTLSTVNGLPVNDPKICFKSYNYSNSSKFDLNAREQVIALYDILNISIPAVGIVVITNHDKFRDNQMPLIFMVSEAVKGSNPKNTLEIPNNLNYGLQVLGAILTNPSEGRAENFIYSKSNETLIVLENDHVFNKECTIESCMNIRTILFTLPNMQKVIDQNISKLLKIRSCSLMILEFIKLLNQKQSSYEIMKMNLQFQLLQQQFNILTSKGWKDYFLTPDILIHHYSKLSAKPIKATHFEGLDRSAVNEKILGTIFHFKSLKPTEDNIDEVQYENQDIIITCSEDKIKEKHCPDIFQILNLPINYKGNACVIMEKLKKIQNIFSSKANNNITYEKILESISPLISSYYKELKSQYPLLQDQLFELFKSRLNQTGNIISNDNDNDNDNTMTTTKICIIHHQSNDNSNLPETINRPKLLKNICAETIIGEYSSVIRGYLKLSAYERNQEAISKILKSFIRDILELKSLNLLNFNDNNIKNIYSVWVNGRSLFMWKDQEEDWNQVWILITKYNPTILFWSAIDKYLPIPNEKEMKEKFKIDSLNTSSTLISPKTAVGLFSRVRMVDVAMYKCLFPNFQIDQISSLGNSGKNNIIKYPQNEPDLCFKKDPEFPLLHYAATALMQLLGLRDVPQSEIFMIALKSTTNLLSNKVKSTPILVSQAIQGVALNDALRSEPNCLSNLDHVHTARLILAMMLLNAEEGKEENFMLVKSPKRLIPIDNDRYFIPSSQSVQIKNIIYCLDEMLKPLPKEVYEQFANMDVDLILTMWLQILSRTEEQNLLIFVSDSLKADFRSNGILMQFLFANRYIEDIYFKLKCIQQFINTETTPFDIMKNFQPFLFKKYEEVFGLKDTPKERFLCINQIFNPKKNENDKKINIENIGMSWVNDVESNNLSAVKVFEKFIIMKNEWSNKDQNFINKLIFQENIQKVYESFSEFLRRFSIFSTEESKVIHKLWHRDILPDILIMFNTKQINSCILNNLLISDKGFPKGYYVKILDLRQAKEIDDACLSIFCDYLPNLKYLNLSGCPLITKVSVIQWLDLQRLILNCCEDLKAVFILKGISLQILEVEGCNRLKVIIHNNDSIQIKNDASFKNIIGQINTIDFKQLNVDHTIFTYLLQQLKLESINIDHLNFTGFSLLSSHRVYLTDYCFSFLKSLSLQKCNLNSEDVQILLDSFSSRNVDIDLESLDLSSNLISNYTPLLELMHNLKFLVKLNLQNNYITDEGVGPLVSEALKHSIFELNLTHNPINTQVYQNCIRFFENLTDYITILSIGFMKSDLKTICASFDDGILRLSQKNIGNIGVDMLIERVNNLHLHTISICHQEFRDEVFNYLANKLSQTDLKVLKLKKVASQSGYLESLESIIITKSVLLLDLSSSEINDEICELIGKNIEKSSLIAFILDNNKITEIGFENLLASITKLKLFYLSIRHNKIRSLERIDIDNLCTSSNIIIFNINNNDINDTLLKSIFDSANEQNMVRKYMALRLFSESDISYEYKRMIIFEILTAYKKDIDDILYCYKSRIGRNYLNNLISLNLKGNNISHWNHIKLFFELPILEFLDLQNNQINSESLSIFTELKDSFSLKNKLMWLNLKNNLIDNQALSHLSAWIIKQVYLVEIDILLNKYTKEGLRLFINQTVTSNIISMKAEFFIDSDTDIEPVRYSKTVFNYPVLSEISMNGMKLLAHILPNTSISTLNFELSAKPKLNLSIEHLIAGLAYSNLEELNLANTNIEPNNLVTLIGFLPSTNIKALNLSGNKFALNTFNTLCELLDKTELIWLNIQNCDLRDDNISMLANTMKDTRLLYLNLKENKKITKKLKKEICKSLQKSQLLLLLLEEDEELELPQVSKKCLTLSINMHFSKFVIKILSELILMTNLCELDVNECGIEDKEALILRQKIQLNRMKN